MRQLHNSYCLALCYSVLSACRYYILISWSQPRANLQCIKFSFQSTFATLFLVVLALCYCCPLNFLLKSRVSCSHPSFGFHNFSGFARPELIRLLFHFIWILFFFHFIRGSQLIPGSRSCRANGLGSGPGNPVGPSCLDILFWAYRKLWFFVGNMLDWNLRCNSALKCFSFQLYLSCQFELHPKILVGLARVGFRSPTAVQDGCQPIVLFDVIIILFIYVFKLPDHMTASIHVQPVQKLRDTKAARWLERRISCPNTNRFP